MISLNSIVDDLTKANYDVAEALMKTKVVAFKLKNQPLLSWINNEYNGYDNEEDLPDYRIIGAIVKGSIRNRTGMFNNFSIPIQHLGREMQDRLTSVKFAHSLPALIQVVSRNDESLKFSIPPEAFLYLSGGLDGYHVVDAHMLCDKSQITQIISTVRSKLLDFILALEGEIGNDVDAINNRENASLIASHLFNSAIIGDNATIVFGSSNNIEITNHIQKSDFSALENLLRQNSVEQEDIQFLKEVIDVDNTDHVNKRLGEKVKSWLKKMTDKSIDATWKVGIAAAGKILGDGLKAYYGWP